MTLTLRLKQQLTVKEGIDLPMRAGAWGATTPAERHQIHKSRAATKEEA